MSGMLALKRAGCWLSMRQSGRESLASKSIEGASLPLEGIDNIHGSDSLPLGMLSVGDSIPDHIFQENFEDSSGFLIDQATDSFDTTSASQSSDGRLRDTLDVVSKDLSVTLGASLSKSFSSFASSRHIDLRKFVQEI